jgi:hypothetical protein
MKSFSRALLAAAALTAAFPAAHAQRVSKITAGKLAEICNAPKGRPLCDAYIAGVSDALAGAKHFEAAGANGSSAGATCIPSDVSTDTLRSTVHDFLAAHADMRGKPAAVPVVDALHAAYPCK